jgi:hypothetical protein
MLDTVFLRRYREVEWGTGGQKNAQPDGNQENPKNGNPEHNKRHKKRTETEWKEIMAMRNHFLKNL